MEAFATYSHENEDFYIALSDGQGKGVQNSDVQGIRFSLLFVESGSGIAKVNESMIPYIAPCVFCIQENETIMIPESDGSVVKAVYFHPSVINSSLNFDNIRVTPIDVPLTMSQDKEMVRVFMFRDANYRGKMDLGPVSAKKTATLIEGIHKLTHEQPGYNWPCRSRSYLLELLFLLDNLFDSASFSEEAYFDTVDEDFYPILLYIYHNYEKKIAVTDIENEFHINRTTLAKKFQDNVNESFLSYLNKLRVTMAATMLRDTMLPVGEIMMRVGFYDNAHFLRTFKKYTGFPPSTYREKYCWL